MTQKAREATPVGEAHANPDLVEGIARDIHWATTLMRPNSPTFDELYPDVKETMRTLARAALNHISSLGMVVVLRSVLTPRDDSHLVLQLRDTASRIADVDDHLVVHLAADALEARTVSVSDMGIPMSASVGEANTRDERAVTDNGGDAETVSELLRVLGMYQAGLAGLMDEVRGANPDQSARDIGLTRLADAYLAAQPLLTRLGAPPSRARELETALTDVVRKIEARSELFTSDEQLLRALIAHCNAALSKDRGEAPNNPKVKS